MNVRDAECALAGIDPKRVAAIARRIEKAAADAQAIGLFVFGGSGSGSLRVHDSIGLAGRPLIVAEINGPFDGGDGACWEDSNGMLRGEG